MSTITDAALPSAGVARRRLYAIVGVILMSLPAMWPLLSHSGYWQSDDGSLHLYRLYSLESAWRQGNLYPRLFPDFAFGYGFSVLNFYGPLSYYIALWVRSLGIEAVAAMRLTFALSYLASALAMWAFVRDLWRREDGTPNELAGVVAALAYTYVPYHFINVQVRGALAESWAMIWWPLILWSVWRGHLWRLTLSVTALVLTHNLSVLLMAPVATLWAVSALVVRWRDRALDSLAVRRYLLTLLIAAVGAGLLALPYWLPVLLESRYVFISQDAGGLGFLNHIAPLPRWIAEWPLYQYRLTVDDPLFRFSWAQVMVLMAALIATVVRWRGGGRRRIPLLMGWAMVAGSIFLLLPASIPLWQRFVVPFGLMQYPWRWQVVTALGTALVAAWPMAYPHRVTRWLPLLMSALLLWMAVVSLVVLPYVVIDSPQAQHPSQMWQHDQGRGQVGATWTAEFLPLTVQEQRWAISLAPQQIPTVGERSPLRLRAASSDGFTLQAEVEAEAPGWLSFPRFAYPSFRATLDGREVASVPQGLLGLAGVEVPSGNHTVTLHAEPLATRLWLARLLWLPWLILLAVALLRRTYRQQAIVALLLLVPLVLLRVVAVQPYTTQPVEATDLGPTIQLMGSRFPAWAVRADDTLHVTLFWFNREQTATHYSTFLHLTPLEGSAPFVADDNEPNEGMAPTPRWLPGQLVEDLHLLHLPADLAPGRYALWGGMYTVADGQAVPLPGDDGARRFLGEIVVR